MPITVTIQVARDVAMRSVGEKRSPFPLLSTGASVSKWEPDLSCVHIVRSAPSYTTKDVIMLFCLNLREQPISNSEKNYRLLYIAAAYIYHQCQGFHQQGPNIQTVQEG